MESGSIRETSERPAMTRWTLSSLSALLLLTAIAAPSIAGDEYPRGLELWPDPFREDPAAKRRASAEAEAVAREEATPGILDAPWGFGFDIYGWLPRAPVELSIDGREIAELPESLDTILESLEMMAMFRAHVRKGPVRLFGDFLYYEGKYEDDVRGPISGKKRDLEIREYVWLVKYGLAYDIVQKLDCGDDEFTPTLTWGPYIGFLGFHDKFREKLGPDGDIDAGRETKKMIRFNAPIVGLSLDYHFLPRWGARLEANMGGWDVDHVNRTYELNGEASYHFTTWDVDARVFAGYRFLKINLKANDIEADIRVDGAVFGIGWTF
jgi:hypothetical protein